MDWRDLQERLVELLRRKEPSNPAPLDYLEKYNRMPTMPRVRRTMDTQVTYPTKSLGESFEEAKRGPYY